MSTFSRYLDPLIVEQLKHLQLSARSVVEGAATGLHRSPLKGASVEFRQHRFYVPGDEPRRLDWRVLARTDRPYVREYDEETNLRCVFLLDCSGSMGYGQEFGSKLEYAARLVASLGYLMLSQTESVGLGLFTEGMDTFIKPHAGPQQLPRLLDALERTAPAGRSAPAAAMHALADRLRRRSLVMVLSDFFAPADQFREGLARLRHDRHEVVAIQALDRDEEEFPFQTWSRFRGLEGERPCLGEPSLVRSMYLENFQRHRRHLVDSCRLLSARFHACLTDQPLIDILRALLCS